MNLPMPMNKCGKKEGSCRALNMYENEAFLYNFVG